MDKRTVLAVGLIIAVIGLYNLVIIPRFSPPRVGYVFYIYGKELCG